MVSGGEMSIALCIKSHKISIILALVLGTSVLSACVGFFLIERKPPAEATLRFVSVIHRHGERAPERTYPLDPYQGESAWPEGLGALLQKGKESMFNLGCFLRRRYDGFLSTTYSPAEIFVLSSRLDRCIMSVQLLLAGLYPPIGTQMWNPDLLWQPIPVHSLNSGCDDIIRVSKQCRLLSRERRETRALLQQEINKHDEFLKYLSQESGLQVDGYSEVNRLYDNLLVVGQQGLPLPQWAQGDVLDRLRSLALVGKLGKFKSPVYVKLESGVLINEILSNMAKKTNSSNNFGRRLSLYSAHDATIVRLWGGLKISREVAEVDYGAVIIIELHQIKDKYRVKILYKKSTSDENLEILKVQGCEYDQNTVDDGMCDLDSFSAAMQSSIITNFDEACQNRRN
ncbi:testicular acid phosphatase homolog isoform X1 [Bemisia tabaci]|uniref:testicular acid phosphatase homolog isoform X1 n=2 Tax=Bemisia tabaci TaxID=7038 RepID=UPI003B2816EF